VVLAAEQVTEPLQIRRFAHQLTGIAGGTARVADLHSLDGLLRLLVRLADEEPLLVVLDDLPALVGTTRDTTARHVDAIARALAAGGGRLRVALAGSGTTLHAPDGALQGLVEPQPLEPLSYDEAQELMPDDRFTRFAVTGGTPGYLTALRDGTIQEAICEQMLRPGAPLWDEGRRIVGQHRREPALHFSLLELMAAGMHDLGALATALDSPSSTLVRYLAQLHDAGHIRRHEPFGASPTHRRGRWQIVQPFLRTWFRFVFPHQVSLREGISPEQVYRRHIAPHLDDHLAEALLARCREHVRQRFGRRALHVGGWWGLAAEALRETGLAPTEQIDLVASDGRTITVVGLVRTGPHPVTVAEVGRLRLGGFGGPARRRPRHHQPSLDGGVQPRGLRRRPHRAGENGPVVAARRRQCAAAATARRLPPRLPSADVAPTDRSGTPSLPHRRARPPTSACIRTFMLFASTRVATGILRMAARWLARYLGRTSM
jgi:hypothetical protein